MWARVTNILPEPGSDLRAACVTLAGLALLLSGCSAEHTVAAGAIPAQPKSGYHYQSAEEQALQNDSFANPGYLWVDEGRALFENTINQTSCSSCHAGSGNADSGNAGAGDWQRAATRYPAYDSSLDRVITLEQRINQCRTRYQHSPPLAWESRQLLALTAYVAHEAKGQPIALEVNAANQQSLSRGERYYHLRKGQLNLACRHCHEQNPGRMLRGDRLSEGLPTGYPAYKLEWQALGSLQRRLRDCDIGVRAEPYDYGSETYADLELYLKVRANGLLIDTPAVRR